MIINFRLVILYIFSVLLKVPIYIFLPSSSTYSRNLTKLILVKSTSLQNTPFPYVTSAILSPDLKYNAANSLINSELLSTERYKLESLIVPI